MRKLIYFIIILFSIQLLSFELEWSFETGDRILSHPFLDEGIVYFGSNDNKLYALNAENGELVWNYEVDHNVQSQVVIHDSLLFFESGNNHFALNKNNGDLIWSNITNDPVGAEKLDYWDYHHAAPIIVDNTVIFSCGNGSMYIYNLQNGNPVNTFQSIDSAALRSTPANQETLIYFGDWNGILYAYNFPMNYTTWSIETYQTQPYPTFGQINTKPVLHDSLLIFGARNPTLQVFDSEDGSLIWDYTVAGGGWISGDALVMNDTLFIGGSDCNKMFAFNVYTGELFWEYTFLLNNFSEPVIYEDMIIFTTGDAYAFQGTDYGDGYLYALNRTDGSLVNYDRIGGNLFTTPIINDGLVFVGSSDKYFYCINLNSFLNPSEAESNLFDSQSIKLHNYPNPFNPTTTIAFDINEAEHNATISVYNSKGQLVKEVLNKSYQKGKHKIIWNGKNTKGETVNSGVYYVKFESNNRKSVSKILMLK